MTGKGPPSRFNRRALNPAFAAAHGISTPPVKTQDDSSGERTDQKQISDSSTNSNRLSVALRTARSTGKLNLSNVSLCYPLPSSVFDLRSEISVNFSLDRSENSWDCYGEETLTSVDFSDNDLRGLDPRMEHYHSLQVLRARRCNLSEVSMQILSKFESLTILDLSSNQIKGQFCMDQLPTVLVELNVSNNFISSLTSGAKIQLPYLRSLDISQNQLTALPSHMHTPNLQNFLFSDNGIQHFPDYILPSSISTLDGSQNKLSAFPNLSGCQVLRVVDLSQNQLGEVPTIHPSLERLHLNQNCITSLSNLLQPPTDCQITELHLSENKMSALSPEIVNCFLQLQFLDVSRNDLRDVPYQLGYLPNLRKVNLEGNKLRRGRDTGDIQAWKKSLRKRGSRPDGEDFLEEEIDGELFGKESGSTVKGAKSIIPCITGNTLNLSGKTLTSLPENIHHALASGIPPAGHNVKTLNLKKNSIKSITEEWLQVLPNLTFLDASFNQLQSLPRNLSCVNLTTLLLNRNHLSCESISDIPSLAISPLSQHLVELNLSSNNITQIPTNLHHLSSLSTLILSYNSLSNLQNFQPPPLLTHLDLSDNQLTNLNTLPFLLKGTQIKILKISNNSLQKIPLEIGFLTQLEYLDLRGNPQRMIRGSILEQKCEEILKYLASRMDDDMLKKVRLEMESMEGVTKSVGNKQKENEQSKTCNVVNELKEEIDRLTIELNNVHLTQAKKYAMKKNLAMKRAQLIKEGRKMKSEQL